MSNQLSSIKVNKYAESWMTTKWRPMMAIMYMIACSFDFVLFPIMFTIVQFWEISIQNDAFRQWAPITLQGGGLFHVAMGAVLGVSAWSRGQEKISGATLQSRLGTAVNARVAPAVSGAFTNAEYAPVASWQSATTAADVVTGFGGKTAPVIPPFPEK